MPQCSPAVCRLYGSGADHGLGTMWAGWPCRLDMPAGNVRGFDQSYLLARPRKRSFASF